MRLRVLELVLVLAPIVLLPVPVLVFVLVLALVQALERTVLVLVLALVPDLAPAPAPARHTAARHELEVLARVASREQRLCPVGGKLEKSELVAGRKTACRAGVP